VPRVYTGLHMHAYTCRNGHGRILLVGDRVEAGSAPAANDALTRRLCPLCPEHPMPGIGGYCDCCAVMWEAGDEGVRLDGVHLLTSDHA
jgi:hypothetical protein